ncbi:MAG: hypothetical protein KFH87_14525, partial [Bacteroidetes bacterium]|nr:hypothetical protein [Bacteroidota bacterium]
VCAAAMKPDKKNSDKLDIDYPKCYTVSVTLQRKAWQIECSVCRKRARELKQDYAPSLFSVRDSRSVHGVQ